MEPATPRKKLSMLPPLLVAMMPVAWVSRSIQVACLLGILELILIMAWIVYKESCWIKAAVLIPVVLFAGRYEKLQRWDDALKAYTTKSAQATSQRLILDATLGNSYCSVFIPNPKFFGWRKGSQELSEQGFNISLKEV
ncbi:unnamed protein product [Lactuca saligna]|uniref:Uncharacterized protein n=1 Tax=Lactuca saligna TaxID=75948 RepID=A0AA35ZF61_LACSI|nr:unnamed protein product [Lactuca saligna]